MVLKTKPKTIADYQQDGNNANKGTARGRSLLEHSFRQLGAGRSILVDKNSVAIAGNKSLEVAAELGLAVKEVETDGNTLIVVKRTDLDLLTDPKAKELAIADNRTSEVGLEWDGPQLESCGVELAPWFTEGELVRITGKEASGTGGENSNLDYKYQIIIDCETERDQLKALEQLEKMGLTCRPLIL